MAASAIADDSRLILLRNALEERTPRRLPRTPDTREAAVALFVRPRDALELLLIKRANHAADPWSGHMALPGGRREPGDRTLLETALREADEEVSIAADRAGVPLGALDEVEPRTRRLPPIVIAPFVIGVAPGMAANPNPTEVEAALWVPLPALRSEEAVSEILVELEDGDHAFPSLRYGEHVIWGLTHRILLQFLEIVDQCGL